MRQCRWMESPGKAIVVADALSRKSRGVLAGVAS